MLVTCCTSHATNNHLAKDWQNKQIMSCNELWTFCFCFSDLLLLQLKVRPPGPVCACPNIAACPWSPANSRELLKLALETVKTTLFPCLVLPLLASSSEFCNFKLRLFIIHWPFAVYYIITIISTVVSLSVYNLVCEKRVDFLANFWSRALATSGGVVLLHCQWRSIALFCSLKLHVKVLMTFLEPED